VKALLAHRDARLLIAGQTLSAFGDWALLIVMAVWVKSLTGSSAQAGLTFFCFAVGSLGAPLGGLVADRVRRRPLMIATDLVLGAAVLVLLLVHDRGDVWLVYLVALLYGLAGTIFFPARSALLRVMLPEELLAEANGALSATREGLRLIAPLTGAAIYAAAGGGAGGGGGRPSTTSSPR
jgi:MFS family permease